MASRTDVYYEDGKVKAKDHNPDAQPLPEMETPLPLKSGKFLDELASEDDDPVLNNAQRTYQAAQKRWNELEQMRKSRDPRDTQAAHLEKLSRTAKANREKALKAVDDARFKSANAAHDVERNAFKDLGMGFDATGNSEVRAAIKGMNDTERNEYISNAISEGDTDLLRAIVNAPHPVAVGMKSKSELENVRERILSEMAPHARKKRDAYSTANKRLVELTAAWVENEDALTAKELRELYEKRAEKAAQVSKAAGDDLNI